MHKIKNTLLLFFLCAGLLLGCWENHVALFLSGETVPIEVYPISLEMLPQEDRNSLLSGIPLSGAEELNVLLEDFLS